MKLKQGKISISFGTSFGGDHGEFMTLTIEDSENHVRVLRAEITYEQIGRMMTGMHVTDIEATFGNLDLIGTETEQRTHQIGFEKGKDDPNDVIDTWCRAIRKDDPSVIHVRGNASDLGNMHKSVANLKDIYNVGFTLYRKKDHGQEESE
jgi:hypothetical protein